jgi:ribosomal protein S18 acetylase RimI-like enzyme
MKRLLATKSQLLEMLKLHNKAFPNSKWGKNYFEKFFSEKYRAPICVFVVKRKKIAGFAIGHRHPKNKSNFVLCLILVAPYHRGKKIGNELMIKFFAAAFELPWMKTLILHFRESNRRVKKFYTQFGFKNHRISGKYSNGEKKHYMSINRKSINKYLAKSKH